MSSLGREATMTASDTLRQTWELVRGEGPRASGYYHRRIPIQSTFPAYAGIVYPDGACRISLLSDNQFTRDVPLRHETKGYCVDMEPSPAGHPQSSFINITVRGAAFTELFTILAADILQQWVNHDQPRPAVDAVHRRLQHWRRFFQRGDGGLSREEYIGLYAELTFLETLLDAGIAPDPAVNAWQGPLGTNQDFLFGTTAVEVKCSTGNDADKVQIANERQLDSVGLKALYLFHIAFDFRENAGRTLSQLITALTDRLHATAEAALLTLDDRLLAAGYAPQVPSPYDAHGFTERKRKNYEVRDGFPRLVESALPSGVSEVSYTLNLSGRSTFQVSMDELTGAIGVGVHDA
jgi:hypothetical protein